MARLKLGIVGLGHLGSFHAQLASQIEDIELTGIYDLDMEKSQNIASKMGTKCYTDLDTLMTEVQALSIVVPTEKHYSLAVKALQKNCHLFIEKPVTAHVHEAEELADLAQKKKLIIQVGHVERFNPAILALNDIKIKPLFIESHRLSKFNPRGTDVSVILDLMIHDLDIILSLMKTRPKSIQACGVSVVSDAEDIANVRLEFPERQVANVTCSRISAKNMRKMRIFQKNAYISIDFLEKKSEILSLEGSETASPNAHLLGEIGSNSKEKGVLWESPDPPSLNPLEHELRSFAQAVLLKKKPLVSILEGLDVLKAAHEILKQIRLP